MSDYHAILNKLEKLEADNLNANDGFEHSPVEIYSYLRAVMYQARNKFNPLWNMLVVGGFKDGEAFLGSVTEERFALLVNRQEDHRLPAGGRCG